MGHPCTTARAASLVFAVLAPCLAACSDDGPRAPTAAESADRLARELAAARFAEDQLQQAASALAPLVARAEPLDEDLLRAAIVELALHSDDRARPLLDRAAKSLSNSPALHYNQGQLAFFDGDLAAAAKHFARAKELAPDDLPTRLMLAKCLLDTDEAAAERELRELIANGPEKSGSFHLTALYLLGRLCIQSGRDAESHDLLERWSRLKSQGLTDPGPSDVERGNFGRLTMPERATQPPTAPSAPPVFAREPIVLAPLAGVTGLAAWTAREDWTLVEKDGQFVSAHVGPPDLFAWGANGLALVTRQADGTFTVTKRADGPIDLARGFDLDRDGDLDFWIAADGKLALWIADGDAFAPRAIELPPLPEHARITDLELVDFDHDGDLDVLLVGLFGARLWRDDGAAQSGTFHDVTADAGLDDKTPDLWCLVEDFDTDQDVDLLVGGPAGVTLYDNLRGGKFARRSNPLPYKQGITRKPVVADFDGDGRPDLWVPEGHPEVVHGAPGGAFVAANAPESTGVQRALPPTLADLNLDGAVDALWSSASEPAVGILSLGRIEQASFAVPGRKHLPPDRAVCSGDFDGDGAVDFAVATDDSVELYRGTATSARHIRLALRGAKDNRRGVGAIVEVRAGEHYRRIFWNGEPEDIGLGSTAGADWIRVTWPNGVTQHVLGVAAGSERLIPQREGLVGSCPFLYTWNGERYVFITDVLGITPLGLPMAPGELVPPDHDEFVLIRGADLAPRDGKYSIQLTEELREVTYLDRVRLDVVDHPSSSEIYPDERFTFPPFPTPHTHTVVAPLAPVRVTGSDGVDWTSELAAIDGRFAAPFRPYHANDPLGPAWGGQFLGLAPEHSLELTFEGAAIARAKKLRLVMTGWFYWTDASVNMASSRTPSIHFVPPLLAVPDGHGGWKDTGPPIGFPAGKLKSMVLDVTDLLVRDDPRIRLTSTLRLYWDSIRLATDDDDAPLHVTSIEPSSARLWERGFSQPIPLFGEHALDWFEWDRLSPEPRWNQHPGLYTRLGDVLPLVGAIDDRFVVMGAGDALELAFDARPLPPLAPGYVRDFLLFLDGWAKDRDPNTLSAETVEPLPFHGMSGYPYGAGESFPSDESHRAWRREWQTRPSKRWIGWGPTRDP